MISFLDIDPINENHVLIIPKQHVDTIEELSDETLSNIVSIAKKIVTALKEIYGNKGYSKMVEHLLWRNKPSDKEKDEVPKTGESDRNLLPFMLMLLSGLGAVFCSRKKEVYKKEN